MEYVSAVEFRWVAVYVCQAVRVEYLELCDKYSIGWLWMYKPPAGRKTRLRAWQLLMRSVKSAFTFTFGKSNKTYSASDFAFRLVFGWNMVYHEQIFM